MRDPGPLRPFLDIGPVVLDGGLATQLERRGADLRDPLWSARMLLENPALIADVHRAYFGAGADVAITASYQASEQGFAARGIDAQAAAGLLRRSVELACDARDRTAPRHGRPAPLVAASVGPYGAVLADGSEYRGRYDIAEDALVGFHETRLRALVAAGPDLLAIETIPSGAEAAALVVALERLGDPVPAWCSFTVRDGSHLADGTSLIDAIGTVSSSASIAAVGVNCSAPAHAIDAVSSIRSATPLPIVAYPNRGAAWDAAAKAWTDEPRIDMAEVADALVSAGATLVGGCCGTGPGDVRRIADRIVVSAGARSEEDPP
jgi:homocysteine S-methyltransferase